MFRLTYFGLIVNNEVYVPRVAEMSRNLTMYLHFESFREKDIQCVVQIYP